MVGEDLHRNHMESLSLPCEKVLVCKQVIQLLNLDPSALEKASSWQMMSEFLVLEELGSEKSRSSESRHSDAQGEFGVTWSAEASCDAEKRVRSVKRADFVILDLDVGVDD